MTVTSAYLDLLSGAPAGLQPDRILYFAVGTGTSTPTSAQIKLDAEAYRNNFQTPITGSAGSGLITMTGFIDLAFGNVNISEVGLFCSSSTNTATITANTGVMIARGLYSHSKKSSETVSLAFAITFKAG